MRSTARQDHYDRPLCAYTDDELKARRNELLARDRNAMAAYELRCTLTELESIQFLLDVSGTA